MPFSTLVHLPAHPRESESCAAPARMAVPPCNSSSAACSAWRRPVLARRKPGTAARPQSCILTRFQAPRSVALLWSAWPRACTLAIGEHPRTLSDRPPIFPNAPNFFTFYFTGKQVYP
ncbi:hypothetical protein GUJ93_ZPchr0003g17383 [Zizania palustris]|uniref:Uncharacterized protein n=1 Tax=Zizania palustris TaxID=103762 RepID=A0A8J5V5N9_ZIZPA|nr:hypothetical protein GUJ93_ZPchr0003g17383 [Zizania palustris]